ncbi:MAG: glycosyltransferase [Planctomycetota bacterium]
MSVSSPPIPSTNPPPTHGREGSIRLAVVANVPTPYRVAFHNRLATEVSGLRLTSVFTHARTQFVWQMSFPDRIGPVFLASGEDLVDRRWGRRAIADWKQGGRVIDTLKRERINAVISMGYSITMLRAMRWCGKQGIPVFLRGDSNIRCDHPPSALHRWVKQVVVGRAVAMSTGVMPMGELGRAYFERYGAKGKPTYLVPYEPDYARFANVENEAMRRFRAEHGLVEGRRYLLYSGRLAPVKRVDLLLAAFSEIADERPDVDLLIAGDGELRQTLTESAKPADRIKWLGFLDGGELPLAYNAAEALVVPSDYEPWALVVNEAMGAGLPVIASDIVGAAHELVVDGESGWCFPSGDRAALTDALRQVTDPDRRSSLRDGVRRHLARWRRDADPVEGVRQALRDVGLYEGGGDADGPAAEPEAMDTPAEVRAP